MINERKEKGEIGGQNDLLSRLIEASDDEKGSAQLSDREIIGKIFILITCNGV